LTADQWKKLQSEDPKPPRRRDDRPEKQEDEQ
jgi:hypothetical protein